MSNSLFNERANPPKDGDAKPRAYGREFLLWQPGRRNGSVASGSCSFRAVLLFIIKGAVQMQASYINPFLTSSMHVLETMISIKPSIGQLHLKNVSHEEDHIWLKIGVVGQMSGDILFGFPTQVALMIVSAMMGGFAVTEFDEMGKSAIGELGNMISGNAFTILSKEGIQIDITPPMLLQDNEMQQSFMEKKAFAIPLKLESIGEFNIFVII